MEAVLTEQRMYPTRAGQADTRGEEQAVQMRNRARIAKALSEEPDYEGLKEGYRIVEAIHKAVIEHGTPEMTMEEIDAEIAECRRERRERGLK